MSKITYGLLLCDDLVFTSRITGTATALGLSMRAFKSALSLLDFARQTPPCCVIIDLNLAGANIESLVPELRAIAPGVMLIGYGSHVDTATLKRARDAGCDVVWPRSKFAEELPTALPSWFPSVEAS